MRFLFWNINRKPLQNLIASIVGEHDVDVILIAENEIPLVRMLNSLNYGKSRKYTSAFSPNTKIQVFSRLPDGAIRPLRDFAGVSIRHLIPPVGKDILLVGAHLSSKLYHEREDQTQMCVRIARLVEEQEKILGHNRTIMMGDFNLNPFEPGAVAADAFHGVMSRRIAQKQTRTIDGVERKFFYNPM